MLHITSCASVLLDKLIFCLFDARNWLDHQQNRCCCCCAGSRVRALHRGQEMNEKQLRRRMKWSKQLCPSNILTLSSLMAICLCLRIEQSTFKSFAWHTFFLPSLLIFFLSFFWPFLFCAHIYGHARIKQRFWWSVYILYCRINGGWHTLYPACMSLKNAGWHFQVQLSTGPDINEL